MMKLKILSLMLLLMETLLMPAQSQDPWCLDTAPWTSATVVEEPLYFIQETTATQPSAPLLFTPESVTSVISSDRTASYQEGKDYVIDAAMQRVLLPAGSAIPFKTRDQMYPAPGAPNSIDGCIDGVHHLRWGEADYYVKEQVLITYRHPQADLESWQSLRPASQTQNLARTIARLSEKQPLKLVLFGDSISEGANASKSIGREPHMPAYGELVAQALRDRYGCQVDFKNLSKGGMTADWGAENAERVAQEKPDLLIIAFGMNDGYWQVETPRYLKNITTIMDATRKANPAAQVILVATMVGNPEWTGAHDGIYEQYRQGLLAMAGPGVAVADMTSLWRKMLERKRYADLTGNGVNHPNDFGHRLYAQMILGLLEAPVK